MPAQLPNKIVQMSMHELFFGILSLMLNYSEGQKHVIQQKYSQELISPNMSSQLQLGNSPDFLFISTGRCQLDDFRDLPLGFVVGCPLIFWR